MGQKSFLATWRSKATHADAVSGPLVLLIFARTHSKDAKSFTDGPATQEVDLKIVVEDDDHVLLAKHICRGLVGV